jgi:CRISPR system Cascade subunit CasD
MSDPAALAFVLDSPLQSWGVDSRYQQRDTAAFPTKSGIIGLLAAALGIDKHAPDESSRLAPYAALRLLVVRAALDQVRPGGRLSDFHTIGGGYDKEVPWQKNSIPRKAGGGPFGTVITRRTYLTGSAFIAILTGDRTVLTAAAAALEDPIWGVWLGRKACLPARPLAPTLESTAQQAFDALRLKLNLPAAALESFDRQAEADPGDSSPGIFHQPDQPLHFGGRSHVSRPVRYERALQSRPDNMFDSL